MPPARIVLFALAWMTACAWHSTHAAQENDLAQTPETSARKLDIVYVPTPQHVVDLMLELADVKPTDLLYDLGCGDGRIVITAAKKYGCQALGVDIDPARVSESLTNVSAANLEHLVTIEQEDIFKLDLSEADVITLYLLPELNVKLIPQLDKMKPGSRVLSHDFDMLGVEPDAVVTFSDKPHGNHTIYLWNVPLNKVATSEDDTTAADVNPPNSEHVRTSDIDAAHTDANAPITGIHPLSAALAYVAQHVLQIVIVSTLALAVILWLARKRLGVIRFHVTFERP